MKRKDWVAAVLIALAASFSAGLTAAVTWHCRVGRWRDTAARLVTGQISARKRGPIAVVADLARRLSGRDRPDGTGLVGILRTASRSHPALSRLMVADPEGRIQALYNPDTPPGHKTASTGGLDAVDSRRKALMKTGLFVEISTVEAGSVLRLELAAPVRGKTGEIKGYVAATVSLDPLRQRLSSLQKKTGIRIVLTDRQGNFVFPLKGGRRNPGSAIHLAGGWNLGVTGGRMLWPEVAGITFLITLLATLGVFMWMRRGTPKPPTGDGPEPAPSQPDAPGGDDAEAASIDGGTSGS
jgi:hypothetical protein